ncbi:MAG: tellurite resistance protein TehB [Methanoregula sp. PtaU1.Bin051]|nr:MAG: tellurite resistance protein TehB [Methanoregula sp. PtaU1.Bin051]
MDFFGAAYKGRPPWDIGRPQKEFIELVRRGEVTGPVLDIGCGTGENALFFAAEGFEVWGIDATPLAVEKAQEKAAARNLAVQFRILDALSLTRLGRTFGTVTDSGLFHTLSDENRPVFTENLAAVLPSGGNYFMLCFSDLEPPGYGPRRIKQQDIRDTFRNVWSVNYIRPAVFESNTRKEGSKAWFSSITKK